MKHRAEMVAVVRYMLISMGLMVFAASCSSSSNSSTGSLPPLPDKMQDAIDLVPYQYSIMPIMVVKYPTNSGLGFDGVFRIRDTYIKQASVKYLACAIAHESVHVDQGVRPANQADELEAIAVQIDCLKEIGGSSSEIQHLENQDGLHYINQNYRKIARGL